MTHVFVGIGSNIDRQKNVQGGIAALSEEFGDLTISPVFESKPFGFEGDDFYNLVVGFNTQLDIENVNGLLRDIEFQFGRHRTESHFSSRTLDIDLLLYGNLVSDEHHVPRHDVTDYSFVLCPLAMIAPDLKHPVSGQSLRDLWQNFDKNIHKISQVNIDLAS
jgi:2-amino-4-hydroxy-6-hydroxymethyldihydropteridine diphosphokinase